ncbi:hypothetical protein DENIS_0359 [Desulfonema ishimotonii]|uniref:BstA-like C-terminal domain-containing protein n=1 Tax=Desulfonema ishimotonii TaxID=45657 RepID=A0A401FR33_9BACT|nr:hypothetical protein [Desulfonema ishimotonii]GBC59420.1 hypothetical protein DENIS_0359 [Desulfonema ishimotonii]
MKNRIITEENGQILLPIMHSEIHKISQDGIEMGVLENGMPYLSQRGLVKMAGIPRTSFQNLTSDWSKGKKTGVSKAINDLLLESGYTEKELFLKIDVNGQTTYAYTEPVVIAVLEYYAFDAKNKSETAQNSFRILTKAGFRLFVYRYTGYQPQHEQLDSWKHFHDRVDLVYDNMPIGYYCIFREIAGMIVSLIREDVAISDKIIPDISVGIHWSKHWKNNNLSNKFGDPIKYEHNYPEYYPQSKSNPQPAHAYPNESLHIFREWFETTYLYTKYPKYILNQSKKGKIEESIANKTIKIMQIPQSKTNK